MIDLLQPELTVEPRPTDPESARYVRSYLVMRVFVGALGIALPFMLVLSDGLAFDGDPFPHGSLSAYYYSGARELFVGALSAIGVFLYIQGGRSNARQHAEHPGRVRGCRRGDLSDWTSARRYCPHTAAGSARRICRDDDPLRSRGGVHRLTRRDQFLLRRAGRLPCAQVGATLAHLLALVPLVLGRHHRGLAVVDRGHADHRVARQGVAHRRGCSGLGVRSLVAVKGFELDTLRGR